MNIPHLNHFRVFILLLLGFFLSGCATTPPTSRKDPYESMNRSIFAFNESVDKNVLKPAAKGYRAVTPDPVEIMITNFYSNLDDVKVIFNDILQLKFREAGSDSARFLINTILGFGGLINYGEDYGFPKRNEDFGQTLGHYDVPSGPYIVLPIVGGSTTRDATAMLVDIGTNPIFYTGIITVGIGPAMGAVGAIDARAQLLDKEEIIDEAALDKYEFIRDAYLQRRHSLIYDGNPPRSMDDELEGPEEPDPELTTSTKKKRNVVIEYIYPDEQDASTDDTTE